MKGTVLLKVLLILATLCVAIPVKAEPRLYVSGELGRSFGEPLDMRGSSTDRASVCDEYINPDFRNVHLNPDYKDTNCVGPNRGSGSGWKNRFGSAEGLLLGAALGYRIPDSRFRVELEYFHYDTDYDETSDVPRPGAVGVQEGKLAQEIVLAIDRIGDITAHNLFANLYLDFETGSRFTPYVGAGVGAGFVDLGYYSEWRRNEDASAIKTGAGLNNAAQIQKNLADTRSVADVELDDTLFGYQILLGMDYALTETLSVGVKGRWVSFGSFRDDDYAWNPLRSHPPYLRKEGAEDREYVNGKFEVGDIELFGVSLNIKKQF